MKPGIAVVIGAKGETTALNEGGELVVFQKNSERWECVRSRPFSLEASLDIKTMRANIQELIDFASECSVLAALSVTGLAYFELEKAGLTIWEVEGTPSSFLDRIVSPVVENQGCAGVNEDAAHPVAFEISPGYWRVSLIEAQRQNRGLSSKQTLLPILNNAGYRILEILCDHVPPWLEMELASGELRGKVETLCPGQIVVRIEGRK